MKNKFSFFKNYLDLLDTTANHTTLCPVQKYSQKIYNIPPEPVK